MPVRRRIDRRRADELATWRDYFELGADFFDHLVDAGIATDRLDIPRELAEAAWHQVGADFLRDFAEEQSRERYPRDEPPFALSEFGPPKRIVGRR